VVPSDQVPYQEPLSPRKNFELPSLRDDPCNRHLLLQNPEPLSPRKNFELPSLRDDPCNRHLLLQNPEPLSPRKNFELPSLRDDPCNLPQPQPLQLAGL
jgi:hypothetical protein